MLQYVENGQVVHLSWLKWGDQIIIHAFGQDYVYAVHESKAELKRQGGLLNRHQA